MAADAMTAIEVAAPVRSGARSARSVVEEHLQAIAARDSDIHAFVHVMADGRIIKSGPKDLALELEEKGYDWVKEHA